MKILLVGPSNRFQSGISTYTIRLANALQENGHEVSVVAFRKLLPRFLFPGAKRVGQSLSVLRFHEGVKVYDEMDYNNPLSWRKARAFLRERKPDALILQWWTSSAAHMHLQLKKAAESLGIPVYVELHEVVDTLEQRIYPIAKYAKVMGPKVIRGNAGYITHSESDKKLVCEAYRLEPGQVTVIPHGNYDHFGPQIAKQDARTMMKVQEGFVFLYFGLIREYKGVPDLIRAFEKLSPEERARSRLLLVGEVWENKEALYAQLAASPAKESITLVDRYVADTEVANFFSMADTVVLPYTRASQSGVAHIAISYGAPLIVSQVGGLAEALADYEGCTFVPPEDDDRLAAAMREALRRGAPATGAAHVAHGRTSWANVTRMYEATLGAAPAAPKVPAAPLAPKV